LIPGGYILQPRKLDESEIIHDPPVVREVWLYVLRKVNHKASGQYKRGQGFFSLSIIADDLHWYVGYRKMKYSKPQLTKSLRRLCERNMMATMKATRGVIVTILNYDYYQDPKNYEGNGEEIAKKTRRKSVGSTKNKNDKNDKNDKNVKNDKKEIEPDFIGSVLKEFQDSYLEYSGQEYVVLNEGKERKAISKLTGFYKTKYPNADTNEAVLAMRTYFDSVMQINDTWTADHMSPTIIISKFNEINKIIKNGNQRKSTKGGTTNAELAKLFVKKFTE